MAKVLILSGSARPNSAGKEMVNAVEAELKSRSLEVVVLNPADLMLPFFNSEMIPAQPGFDPNDQGVVELTKLIDSSSAVVLVAPEYNGSLSAVQKNAIDWVYNEWLDKPVAFVGYGWHGAKRAQENAKVVLENVKAKLIPESVNLTFNQEIDADGNIVNQDEVAGQIRNMIDSLQKYIV